MIYSLESVGKMYVQGRAHVRALHDINLQVASGERLALLGPSGAGKSTLFRLLNGTIRPSAGRVSFEGRDLATLPGTQLRGIRRRIGTIYQQHNLVPSLTALENTLCGALGRWSLAQTVRGVIRPAQKDLEQALQALDSVGLGDKRAARADQLSGGQQQRVAVARVLMQDPDVILADEPIASLDPGLADEITSLLVRVAETKGRTLLVSLHRVELAMKYFPRTIALRSGQVDFDLPTSELRDDLLVDLFAGANAPPTSARPPVTAARGPRCVE